MQLWTKYIKPFLLVQTHFHLANVGLSVSLANTINIWTIVDKQQDKLRQRNENNNNNNNSIPFK